MNFWKPKRSICTECGVHFEPVAGYESRWGNLCQMHRKPVMERDQRKDAVASWAASNWERLAATMDEENKNQRAAYNEAMCKAMAQSQRDAANNHCGAQLGGLAGFGANPFNYGGG